MFYRKCQFIYMIRDKLRPREGVDNSPNDASVKKELDGVDIKFPSKARKLHMIRWLHGVKGRGSLVSMSSKAAEIQLTI